MSKDLWLSQFDPDSVIQLNDVERYPVDVSVINDQLTLLMSDSTPYVVGKFSGEPGSETSDAVILEDNRLQQTLNDGTVTVFDRVREDYVEEIRVVESARGYFSDLNAVGTGNILPFDRLTANSLTLVTMDDGTTITAPNVWGGSYSVIKAFNGTASSTSDGHLWSSGTNATLTINFSTPRYVDEFLFQNMRSDNYATIRFDILIKRVGFSWETIHSADLTGKLMVPYYHKLVNPTIVEGVQLLIIKNGAPSVGRFEVYNDRLADSNVSQLLANYVPLIIDASKFDVVETESALEIALKQSAPGNEPGVGNALVFDVSKYFHVEATLPLYRKQYSAGYGMRVPFNQVKVNTLGLNMDNETIILPPGTYRARAKCVAGGMGHVMLYLLNNRTGYPVGTQRNGYASTTVHINPTFENDTILRIHETTPVSLNIVGSTDVNGDMTGSVTPATISTHARKIASLEIWKLSDEIIVPMDGVSVAPDLPEDSSGVMAPYSWLHGVLNGSGDGRGLFDGLYTNTWSGIASAYWAGAGQFVVVRIDSDFRLWRRGVASYPTYSSNIAIIRLESGDNFTHRHLILPNNNGTTWDRFTDTLPPGTYRFEWISGWRIDSEWFIEAMPLGSAGTIKRYRSIYTPMATFAQNNQIASASSYYGTGYHGYRGHLAFKGHPRAGGGECWASADVVPSAVAPQWLQIRFTDGPRSLDRYVIVNRAGTAGYNPPRDWQLLGKNAQDAEWTVVDTVIDNPALGIGYRNVRDITRVTFDTYRLNVTRVWALAGSYVAVECLELLEEI